MGASEGYTHDRSGLQASFRAKSLASGTYKEMREGGARKIAIGTKSLDLLVGLSLPASHMCTHNSKFEDCGPIATGANNQISQSQVRIRQRDQSHPSI